MISRVRESVTIRDHLLYAKFTPGPVSKVKVRLCNQCVFHIISEVRITAVMQRKVSYETIRARVNHFKEGNSIVPTI